MDTELNLLIVAGIAAVACIAIGLVVGLLRGHVVSQRIREQINQREQEEVEIAAVADPQPRLGRHLCKAGPGVAAIVVVAFVIL